MLPYRFVIDRQDTKILTADSTAGSAAVCKEGVAGTAEEADMQLKFTFFIPAICLLFFVCLFVCFFMENPVIK